MKLKIDQTLDLLPRSRIDEFKMRNNGGGECANLLFCKILAENCMKMKEIGPRMGHAFLVPLPWTHNWEGNTTEVADPGFLRLVERPQPQRGVPQSIIWQFFYRKLHENETNWT